MSHNLVSRFVRLSMVAMLLALMVLSLAKPASAASPFITIAAVKVDETVTVHTRDFPANVNFTVRMDVAGNKAIDGIVVGQTNSGIGGAFSVTYKIPAELRGVLTIAIRMDSAEGWYAYNWFVNRTAGSGTPVEPAPIPVTGTKPVLSFTGVDANKTVTVEARNLPANATFTVRVGPYYTFFRDFVYAPSVTTDANGYVKFSINLPEVVKDVEMVTVRLDGSGRYAFNAFKNVSGGTTIPVTSGGSCQIVSVTPSASINRSGDFDAVWTIKNTSSKTWEANSVDYKFVSGTKMHKYAERFDLGQTVKPGETVKVVVDMIAPSTAGFYTANWALVDSSSTVCNLSLSLRVK